MIEIEKSPLAQLMNKNFPGEKFSSLILKQAGKKLLKCGELKAIEFLTGKGSIEQLPNFKPPVKCLIITKSRALEEFPIYKASCIIQLYVYNLKHEDFKNQFNNSMTSSEQHKEFFKISGLNIEYNNVAGLNLIFKNAKNTYNGVITKIKNSNKKLKNKSIKNGSIFEEIKTFNDDGILINKPGINNVIYCFNGISPSPLKNITRLPLEYKNYNCDIDKAVNTTYINRLDIPKGEPGYVPLHDRYNLNEKKNFRRRRWYSNSQNKSKNKPTKNGKIRENANTRFDIINQAKIDETLLAQIKIGEDWIILDVRGLLRDLNRRKLLVNKNKLTIKKILSFFTGDPIIDIKRNIVTFSYKEGIVPVISREPIGIKKSKILLQNLTIKEKVALVSVDLGQTHPVSARISKLYQINNEIKSEAIYSEFLEKEIIDEIAKYRNDYDLLESKMYIDGINLLDEEDRLKIEKFNKLNFSENCKINICKIFKLNINNLQWDNMSSKTNYIATAFINNGGNKFDVMNNFDIKNINDNKKTDKIKKINQKFMSDLFLCNKYKDKIEKELREKINNSIWNVKINSREYKLFSQRKKELARRGVNWFEKKAKELTKCEKIIFNVENLNMDNRIFSGSGKRETGWDNFFIHKKENRWFIQAFHKAFTDLGKHRGNYIIESPARYTSQTCPNCGICDKNNRNGVEYICIDCGVKLHADLDVATANLEKIAITGIALLGPDCKRLGGVKKARTARKTIKTPNI